MPFLATVRVYRTAGGRA